MSQRIAPLPPDGEPDTAGIEAAKRAVYESMPVVLKDLVARSEAEAAIGVPHGAGVPDRWIADVAVRAYLAAASRAAASPDPRVPSGLPIGYGGPTVKVDPVALLARIKAIVDEPLDERVGYGPTRTDQFTRIDTLLRDVRLAAASPDERLREAATDT